MFCTQPKWLQKMKVGGGATHSKQESRLWSRGLAGGLWEERWSESSTRRRWRLLQKWEKGRNGGCFRRGSVQLVVGIATCGGANGGEAAGGPGWWLERRRERGREKLQKRGQWGWFLVDFGPKFSLPYAMKCSPIYRRWKMNILSLMVPNHGLWFGW